MPGVSLDETSMVELTVTVPGVSMLDCSTAAEREGSAGGNKAGVGCDRGRSVNSIVESHISGREDANRSGIAA